MNKQLEPFARSSLAKSTLGMSASRICVAACVALWATVTVAQPVAGKASLSASANRYPAGSIQTVEQADQALAAVDRERGEIESRYRAEEQACHPKFFATSCIEHAQERRRKATMELRAIEIEANVFKRRVRVDERDKALAERGRQAESDRMEREGKQKEAAGAATDALNAASSSAPADTARRKPSVNLGTDRKERHDDRMARIHAEEAANAKERAANVAEYEKKVQASKARQEEVARRKAEKERKRILKRPPGPASPQPAPAQQ